MNTVVLVPRRSDGGRRDQLWEYVQTRWVGWDVREGHHDDGPFNRSAAINQAAEGDWDVAIIADSDSFVDPAQLDAAIIAATVHGQITFAYERFCYLNRQMSDRVMAGYQGDWWPGVEFALTGTCSSMVVVTRKLWDAVGGFDEGFVGWGFEDVGFSLACQALGGGMQRVAGDVWHLQHPTSQTSETDPNYLANVARMKRYEACNYDPRAMRALLKELR